MNVVEEVKDGKAQLLDVRSKLEWKEGHAKGATHVSINSLLEGHTEQLEDDKPIYVYCASGGRAGMAESYLKQQGYEATNIGGLGNWVQMGGATER